MSVPNSHTPLPFRTRPDLVRANVSPLLANCNHIVSSHSSYGTWGPQPNQSSPSNQLFKASPAPAHLILLSGPINNFSVHKIHQNLFISMIIFATCISRKRNGGVTDVDRISLYSSLQIFIRFYSILSGWYVFDERNIKSERTETVHLFQFLLKKNNFL